MRLTGHTVPCERDELLDITRSEKDTYIGDTPMFAYCSLRRVILSILVRYSKN